MMRKIFLLTLLVLGVFAAPSVAGTVRYFEDLELEGNLSIEENLTVKETLFLGQDSNPSLKIYESDEDFIIEGDSQFLGDVSISNNLTVEGEILGNFRVSFGIDNDLSVDGNKAVSTHINHTRYRVEELMLSSDFPVASEDMTVSMSRNGTELTTLADQRPWISDGHANKIGPRVTGLDFEFDDTDLIEFHFTSVGDGNLSGSTVIHVKGKVIE